LRKRKPNKLEITSEISNGYYGSYSWTELNKVYMHNTYYRLEALTQDGKRAFTNPIFIDLDVKTNEGKENG